MKKKLLILAASYRQYIMVCREWGISPIHDARYVRGWMDMCGWWIDQPVLLFEGYETNPNYSIDLAWKMGNRFENIRFLSDGEIWNENLSVRP